MPEPAHPAPAPAPEALGDGIFAIDTGFQRPRYDAAYLVLDHGRAAFVDTGTAHALPRLLAALAALGLDRAAVDYVIPTHVHLDHAGGVGQLMQALPCARVLVHPRGLRHLLDPIDLWRGALAVYGAETMAREYGALVPVPAERVLATTDGQSVMLGTRELRFAHTPGHCLHHHCIWDVRSQGWFTGDNFGMAYPEFESDGRRFVFPTTTPVQFEPEAMSASIGRLLAAAPRRLYLTHYGMLTDPVAAGRELRSMLAATLEVVSACRAAPQRQAAIARALLELHVQRVRDFGIPLPDAASAALLQADMALNAAGIIAWLERQERPQQR